MAPAGDGLAVPSPSLPLQCMGVTGSRSAHGRGRRVSRSRRTSATVTETSADPFLQPPWAASPTWAVSRLPPPRLELSTCLNQAHDAAPHALTLTAPPQHPRWGSYTSQPEAPVRSLTRCHSTRLAAHTATSRSGSGAPSCAGFHRASCNILSAPHEISHQLAGTHCKPPSGSPSVSPTLHTASD